MRTLPTRRKAAAFAAFAALAPVWALPAAADPGHPGHHDGSHHDGGCSEPGGPSSCCVSVPLPAPGPHPWQIPQDVYDQVAAREHTGPASPGDTVTYCGAAGTRPLLALVEAAIVEAEWAEAEALGAAAAAAAAGAVCDDRPFWVWHTGHREPPYDNDFSHLRRAESEPPGGPPDSGDGDHWERITRGTGPQQIKEDPPPEGERCADRLWGWRHIDPSGEEADTTESDLTDSSCSLRLAAVKPAPLTAAECGWPHEPEGEWEELLPDPDSSGDYRFDQGG